MKTVSALLVLILAAVIVFFVYWGRVPDTLAKTLSQKLGVKVTIASMGITPTSVSVKQIEIGNPPKSILPKAFSCERIEVDAPLTRYLSDNIVIDEISLDKVYLGLEFKNAKGTDGNWSVIMANMKANTPASTAPKEKQRAVLIHKLVLTNIDTDVVYQDGNGKVKHLPTIDRIELTDISSEGGFPVDQLMNSVLGQMLKQVFIKQNMQNMMQDFLNNPPGGGQVDKYLQPFKRFFPMKDNSQETDLKTA